MNFCIIELKQFDFFDQSYFNKLQVLTVTVEQCLTPKCTDVVVKEVSSIMRSSNGTTRRAWQNMLLKLALLKPCIICSAIFVIPYWLGLTNPPALLVHSDLLTPTPRAPLAPPALLKLLILYSIGWASWDREKSRELWNSSAGLVKIFSPYSTGFAFSKGFASFVGIINPLLHQKCEPYDKFLKQT